MNLRDLEYVVALEETRHFGQAAQRCSVTQPGLSMQLANLEAELGVKLFERQPRRVLITPQGRRIAAQAAVVLAEVSKLKQLARPRSIFADDLRLGIIHTAAPYILPHILPYCRRAYPSLRLLINESITSSLLQELLRDRLDAAILSLPLEGGELEYAEVLQEPFMAALPPGHRLTCRQQIAPKELRREPLLLLEQGHCMRGQVEEICHYVRREGVVASSIESLRQMVHAGMGCTVLPFLATIGGFASAAAVQYRPLKTPQSSCRSLVLAWRKTCCAGEELRLFANKLQAVLQPLVVRSPDG